MRFGVRLFYFYEFNDSFNKLRDLLINKFYKNEFFKSVEKTTKISDQTSELLEESQKKI